MRRNSATVFSINNVTPIRADVSISHAGVGSRAPQSFWEEQEQCARYESHLCRICDAPRMRLSPWCEGHVPWTGEVSKEPR